MIKIQKDKNLRKLDTPRDIFQAIDTPHTTLQEQVGTFDR